MKRTIVGFAAAAALTLSACSAGPSEDYPEDSYVCVEADGDECDGDSNHKVKKHKKNKSSGLGKTKKNKSSGFGSSKSSGGKRK